MTCKDEMFSLLATQARNIEPVGKSRHAAAIVHKKGIVVAFGKNSKRTHPLMLKYGRNQHSRFLHAEVDALIRASNTLRAFPIGYEYHLYVVRVGRNGELAYSKPCSGCRKAIKDYGIGKIYHS